MELRDELAEVIQSVVGPLIDPARVSEEWTEAADEILKRFTVTKKHLVPHDHEAWMVRTLDDGTHYCAACGQEVPSPYATPVEPKSFDQESMEKLQAKAGRLERAAVPEKIRSRRHEFHDGDRVVWNDRQYTVVDTTLSFNNPWALLEPKDTDLRTSWVPEREIKRAES